MLKVKIVDSIPMTPIEARLVEAGFARIAAQKARLVARGVLNENGDRLSEDLPEDMVESSQTEV